MKFERMKLPVLTGIGIIEKYNPKEGIFLSSVRAGVPCLIVNSKICDINGEPFKNELFQEYFSEFSKRVSDCKTIVFGRIIDISLPYRNTNRYDFSSLEKITYDAKSFEKIKDKIKIEVEDLYALAIPNMTLKDRHMFLNNMIISIFATTKKTNVEMQSFIKLDEYSQEDVKKFIYHAADRNEIVLFRSEKSIYNQGETTLLQSKSFYLNPFQEFKGKVISMSSHSEEVLELNKKVNIIDVLKIEYENQKIDIDYSKMKESTRKFIYDLIKAKKIADIKFEAILLNELVKFPRAL